MMKSVSAAGLEVKFCRLDAGITLDDDGVITGYASVFDLPDQGGDIVCKGAYAACLKRLAEQGRQVRMLWQHDPAQPIGVWEEIREDMRGLFVRGRFLSDVAKGAEALALVRAGAIDGLSIGYRTIRASRNSKGQRLLQELELWEVSLVTFPMLPEARIASGAGKPGSAKDCARELVAALAEAGNMLAACGQQIREPNTGKQE